jgi:hypothetical protein
MSPGLNFIARVQSRRCCSQCVLPTIFDELQVLLLVLVDLLDEHLQVVWCSHAGFLADGSIECESQLFRASIEREDALVVTNLFAFKFSLWRQFDLTLATWSSTWPNASLFTVCRGDIARYLVGKRRCIVRLRVRRSVLD